MDEQIIECPCGTTKIYQNYISGVANVKHWFIRCKCGKFVECKKKEKAIEMWNRKYGNKCNMNEYIEGEEDWEDPADDWEDEIYND